MKFILKDLSKGDVITAEIVEGVSGGEFIVSVYGDLIRVANNSRKQFQVGERVRLRVTHTNPLSFQLLSGTLGYSISV